MSEESEDLAIKASLPRAWPAFFARHGRLTAIQREAIPHILARKNTLIVSATASGKTEAAIAPLAQTAIDQAWPLSSLLYVSPTRALVNDLYARLSGPLEYLNLTVARRTGDRPEWTPTTQTHVIITTPESLDSILSRHPKLLSSIRAVVLDEIHLLDGTTRGDQVQYLLKRLKFLVKDRSPTICALSATVRDPATIARKYLGPDHHVAHVVGHRTIEWVLKRTTPEDLSCVIPEMEARGVRKAIFFCNTRAEAEAIGQQLKASAPEARVLVHHASLKREVREAVESEMKAAATAYCAATMTLELGIDIGDVDAVVLVGPPPDVNSLLQRIGRGNRRRDDATLAYLLHRDDWEELVVRTLADLVERGELAPATCAPFASVAVQQILSYVFQKQRKGVSRDRLSDLLSTCALATSTDKILAHLTEGRYIVQGVSELYFPGEKLWPLANRGLIHSTFEAAGEGVEVIDVRTGKPVGHVGAVEDSFVLAGRTWRVVRRQESRILAQPIERANASALFEPNRAVRVSPWLGGQIRRRLAGADDGIPLLLDGERWLLVHCLGPVPGRILANAMRRSEERAIDIKGRYLAFAEEPTEAMLRLAAHHLEHAHNDVALSELSNLPLGRFAPQLPRDLRASEALRHTPTEEAALVLSKGIPKQLGYDAAKAALDALKPRP